VLRDEIVKVSSEQQAPREAVLTVELDESDVEPYLNRAYRQLVQRMSIPGFRKGKAPRKIVEQMYGRGYLLNEALDFMVQEVTSKAVQQESLELGGIPSVSIENLDPPSFKATVPLVPSVELGEYQSIRVPRGEVEIKEEQVDTVLEQLRQETAVWEPAEAPVQLDDLINLTVDGWIQEEDGTLREIVHSEETDYIPRTGTRFPVPGFDEGLVGLPQGELAEFTVDVPEDFETAENAGKKALFKATVHSIKRRALPALDDEFAKGVGEGFESLEVLRERIRENLREQEYRNVKVKHEEEVLTKVVEAATIEISPLIIEHELEHFLEEREEKLKAGRVTFQEYQEYLASAGKSPEEIQEETRPKVAERLKRSHVLRQIVVQEGLEVTDEELDQEVETLVADAADQADSIREVFADEDRRDSLRRMLLNRKALAYLTDMASGEAPAKPASSSEKIESNADSEENAADVSAKAEQKQAGGN
jgi:trigger factor